MRIRSLALGIVLGMVALAAVSTAAFADTLTVTFTSMTPGQNSGGQPMLSGFMTSTWLDTSANKTYSYGGSYTATATVGQSSQYCVYNPDAVFTFTDPKTNAVVGTLDVAFQSPLCWNGQTQSSITFTVKSGTGVFSGATGGGLAQYEYTPPLGGLQLGGTGFDPAPMLGATPELDSLVLFGSGIVGVAGYVLLRRRARRSAD
jgi:hypothetical protein